MFVPGNELKMLENPGGSQFCTPVSTTREGGCGPKNILNECSDVMTLCVDISTHQQLCSSRMRELETIAVVVYMLVNYPLNLEIGKIFNLRSSSQKYFKRM